MGEVMILAAVTIIVLMLATWALSLVKRNASIVDIVWGAGFVLVALVVRAAHDGGNEQRRSLLVAMTTMWGVRLALHLSRRNAGHPEDFRYAAMRRKHGERFGLVSLYTVFALQGALMWVVSLPVQLGQIDATPDIGALAYAGLAAWIVGFFFETIGDAQLIKFRADPANAGKVLDSGLWRYTRHPNYFGDACVWWGIGLVAAETSHGRYGLIGPVVMTVLLRRVSGVTLLEKSLVKRRPGYADYVARTSPFLPRPPKKLSTPTSR